MCVRLVPLTVVSASSSSALSSASPSDFIYYYTHQPPVPPKHSLGQSLGRHKMWSPQSLTRIRRFLNCLLDHKLGGHALQVQAEDHLGLLHFFHVCELVGERGKDNEKERLEERWLESCTRPATTCTHIKIRSPGRHTPTPHHTTKTQDTTYQS